MTGLSTRVRTLLADAITVYQGRPAARRLLSVADHLDGPLRVALAGRVKAGKSTLLNALVGRQVAATDAGECTRVATPYPWLADLTLIDTPGTGSLSRAVARSDPGSDVDAVLYLLRHLHASDVDFLDVFHDVSHAARFGHATPVNAVGVLSRADEIGGGRPDAIRQAVRVADGYRRDPRIRELVHTVVPVAGLLAEAAHRLEPDDVAALTALAATDGAVIAPMLMSAARFVAPGAAVGVPPAARQRLLDLLGVYGVRLALDAVRRGAGSVRAVELAQLLTAASGLPRLRRLLLTQFAQRRDVLKADGALRAVDAATRTDPIAAATDLRRRAEQIRVGAHELAEIRLLTELRTGHVPATPVQLSKMEQLLGGDGTAPAARLGLPPDAAHPELAAAAARQHARWQQVARSPVAAPELARAATVAVRTCEGIFATLDG